jgi:hypothetical protein
MNKKDDLINNNKQDPKFSQALHALMHFVFLLQVRSLLVFAPLQY